MTQEISSIPITEHNIQQINLLMRRSKAYWGYDDAFMDKFMLLFQVNREYFQNNTVKLFSVGDKKEPLKHPVGFYGFSINEQEHCELDHFFIDPDFIGQGYGGKMWFVLLEEINSRGISVFTLWSDPGAEAFYNKMGCNKIGVRKSPMMSDRYPVIFEYTLKQSTNKDAKK